MAKLKTQQEILEKFTEVHGNKYDYSKMFYRNTRSLVCIICRTHGEFSQLAMGHTKGYGCPACSVNSRADTLEICIKEFIEKHGERYDYSKVVYRGIREPVIIICKDHGEFLQTPASHKRHGCTLCRNDSYKPKLSDVISKFNEVHDSAYSYENFKYVNSHTKGSMTCEHHGDFLQTPANHLKKQGCPKCGDLRTASHFRRTLDQVLESFRAKHGTTYDYSLITSYEGSDRDKLPIICSKHGVFRQQADNHSQGQGCPSCKKCGYNRSKAGSLYIFTHKNTTKVGITNRSVGTRLIEINKSSKQDFVLVESHKFSDGEIPFKIEKLILAYLAQNYNPVEDASHDGYTECFTDVDLKLLQEFVAQSIYTLQR
jgi:hypothetical protein